MKRTILNFTACTFLFGFFSVSIVQGEGTSSYNMSRSVILPEYGSAAPVKGESRVNSATGATLQRITSTSDATGQKYPSSNMLIVYSRYSPVNVTGEYLLVHAENSTSCYLYRISDRTLVTTIRKDATRDAGEVNEIRWDYSGSHPYRVYMVWGMKFIQIDNVLKQDATRTTIRDFSADFPGMDKIVNDVEGDSSSDSRYWAWLVRAPYTGGSNGYYPIHKIFTYDKQANVILGSIDSSSFPCHGGSAYLHRPNMVEISPNGDKVVVDWGRAGTGNACAGTNMDGPHAFDLNFKNAIKVGNTDTHSGWGYDTAGRQMFVSQNNQTDWIQACDILNGSCFNIIHHKDLARDYNLGFHFGKFYNPSHKGWVLLSTMANSTTYWGQEQLIMLELKPSSQNPRVWRITPTYAGYAGNYRQESQAALDLAGNTIWWNNRWGSGSQTIGHQEVFRVELPTTWYTDLGGVAPPSNQKTPKAPTN